MENDYYFILGVEVTATKQEIKDAYREKSKIVHPDKGGTTEKFTELNEAYKVLSDDEAKKIYDATGKSIYNPIEIEEEANNLLVGVFNEIIEVDLSQFKYGILGYILEELNSRLHARTRDTEIIQKEIDKFEKMLGKITRKEKDDQINLFDEVIQGKIKAKNQDMALAELDIRIIKRSIKIIDEYDCNIKSSFVDSLFSDLTIGFERESRGLPILKEEDYEATRGQKRKFKKSQEKY